ncbi:hypothetical protein [Haloferax sp. YSSS75]|uniref:hypothetical protein n=1 Tax=Haloferax sp. YSSS75 TaxID=3388564 RepID=UPI00398D47C5
MTRRDTEENTDIFDRLPNRPSGWRTFPKDVTGWEILRGRGRVANSREEGDKVVTNAPIVITSVASYLLMGWGLVALGSLNLPRAGYGAVALLGGFFLNRVSVAFSYGVRVAFPFVAAVPPLLAVLVYWWFDPVYPFLSPFDAIQWLAIVAFGLADVTFLFGSIHPSWEAEPGE